MNRKNIKYKFDDLTCLFAFNHQIFVYFKFLFRNLADSVAVPALDLLSQSAYGFKTIVIFTRPDIYSTSACAAIRKIVSGRGIKILYEAQLDFVSGVQDEDHYYNGFKNMPDNPDLVVICSAVIAEFGGMVKALARTRKNPGAALTTNAFQDTDPIIMSAGQC